MARDMGTLNRDIFQTRVVPRATQPGARNGFGEPRDREPKSTLSRPHLATETARPAFEPAEMPANCGLFVRDRETSVRIGLRGGGCSPDRTRLNIQIP